MSRRWLTVLLSAGLALAAAAPQGEAQTTGSISGTVTSVATGAPLGSVTVQAYNSANAYAGSAFTDASGVYTISDLAPGTYYLKTTNNLGYIDELFYDLPCPRGNCYPYTSGTGVLVTAGVTTGPIVFSLAIGGGISGTVTSATTGAPLQGIRVRIRDSNGSRVDSPLFTNSSGFYAMTGLASGTYFVVTEESTEYIDELYNNLPCPGGCYPYTAGTSVAVMAGSTTSGIDFALSPAGVITGTVTSGTGAPLAGAYVFVYNASNVSLGSATTNEAGVYAKGGLPTGNYYARTSNSIGYLDELYNNLPCVGGNCSPYTSGTPIAVTVGATTSGIDFVLTAGGVIAGTVTDAVTGAPLYMVEVDVYDASNVQVTYSWTNSSGAYSTTGLTPGTYYVKTSGSANYVGELYNNLPCIGGSCTPNAGTPVAVTAGSTTGGIDFGLAPAGSITGTVTVEGTGTPLANITVYVYNSSNVSQGTVTTNVSGVYTKTSLAPGTYYVRTSNALGYLDELYNNLPCVGGTCTATSGTGVAVTAGGTTGGIDFALALGGTITGTVSVEGTGTPLANVTVYVYNASNVSEGAVTTNASGVYAKIGLLAGTHYIRTLNSQGYVDELYDNRPCVGSCSPYTSGTGVTVTAGATTSAVDFALAVGGTITGTVTAEGTGTPLSNITVYVYNSSNLSQGTVATNASGVYSKGGLLPGTYYVRTGNTQGYIDELYDNLPCVGGTCTTTSGTGIAVTASGTTSGIDFALAVGGTITGTVTAEGTGTPLSSVTVYVYNSSNVSQGTVATNASGVYSKGGLLPGTYYVRTVNSQGYVDELYSNLPCAGGCSPYTSGTGVAVTTGSTASGINFALALGGSITGTVTAAGSGIPISSAAVYFYNASGASVGYVATNASGVYTKTALAPGTYYARAGGGSYTAEFYDNLPIWTAVTASTPIVVSAGSPTTANFALEANTGPNTSATAVTLPLGTTENLRYTGGLAADTIWYTFEVPPEDAGKDLKVNVRITSPYPVPPPANYYSDVDFSISDATVTARALATSGSDNETLYLHNVAAGWYYIYVPYVTTSYADSDVVARYSITIETGTSFGVGYISGRLVDGDGNGLAQVQVQVSTVPHTHPVSFPTILSNANGYFSAAATPGAHALLFLGEDRASLNVPEVNVVTEAYADKPSLGTADPISVVVGETVNVGDVELEIGAIVTGQVTNQSGTPLAMASVLSYDLAGNSQGFVWTDASGNYTLKRVPVGGAKLRFSKSSYAAEYFDDHSTLGPATVLATQSGATLSNVNAQLTPGGSISGTVKDGEGAPVSVKLYLYSALDSAFNRTTYTMNGSTSNFVFGYVKPGNYKLFVDTAGTDLSPRWYGGALSFADAAIIAVTEGGTTTSINIVLERRSGGDFTGDRKSDLLWHHATRGEVWLWPMDGGTHSESYISTVGDVGWEIRGVGDQTGDGQADLLWRHAPTGMLYLWTMNGGAVAAETYVGTVDPVYDIVGTGDYNGDGKSDILWRHQATGELWLWVMNGAASTSELYVDTVDLTYRVVGSGDLNGDGKADLVWEGAAGDVWVWLMNGAVATEVGYAGTVSELEYEVAAVADYTGDGQADLLWRHATRGELWVWAMAGTTSTGAVYVDQVGDTEYRIVGSGDYDGDGQADLLWHHATRGEVWVWLMDGVVKREEHYVGMVPDTGYRIIR
jgi:ribosomal protein L30E